MTYTYSDRDLMTRQVSSVSGTSTSTYNEREVFAPDTIGGDVTVVISPDGRVLDVLPSL
jgi:hypothetical protein